MKKVSQDPFSNGTEEIPKERQTTNNIGNMSEKRVKIECPFCGYQKQVEVYPVFLDRLWKVECEKCHKCFGVTFTDAQQQPNQILRNHKDRKENNV